MFVRHLRGKRESKKPGPGIVPSAGVEDRILGSGVPKEQAETGERGNTEEHSRWEGGWARQAEEQVVGHWTGRAQG